MEQVPIISPKNLHVLGYDDRDIVVSERKWHFSSLIIPIHEASGKILIQTRPRGKTYEGKLDIFGGYVQRNKFTDQLLAKFEQGVLKKIFLDTARREANEEINIHYDKLSTNQIRK